VRPRFVLASASPRRRELLDEAGYEFEVVSPRVDELAHGWLTIRELTIWNASRKAAAASKLCGDAVVLAADTLVTIATNWTTPCSVVTVGSTNGWDTNFDNLDIQ
jgi:predicted house-cleaning NTP pyrophosphatase (Maf/HAM1 superfamily)